jgi:hypothetical protein
VNRHYLELNKLDGGGSHAAKRGEGPTATLVAYGTASGRPPRTNFVQNNILTK